MTRDELIDFVSYIQSPNIIAELVGEVDEPEELVRNWAQDAPIEDFDVLVSLIDHPPASGYDGYLRLWNTSRAGISPEEKALGPQTPEEGFIDSWNSEIACILGGWGSVNPELMVPPLVRMSLENRHRFVALHALAWVMGKHTKPFIIRYCEDLVNTTGELTADEAGMLVEIIALSRSPQTIVYLDRMAAALPPTYESILAYVAHYRKHLLSLPDGFDNMDY